MRRRQSQNDARAAIIAEAQRQRNRGGCPRPITARHINEAVAIVRHHQLVAPSVLVAAGFNPERRWNR